MRWTVKIICLIYLSISVVYDIKTKQIPVWLLGMGTAEAAGYAVLQQMEYWYLWTTGALMGLVFLLISNLTREAIGYGDSWMIGNLGLCWGIWDICAILFLAFGASALVAGLGKAVRKWPGGKRIPFFPFLLAGYIGVIVW